MKKCKICEIEKEIKDFPPYYGEKRKEGITRNICRKCSSKKNIDNIKNNPERLLKTKDYLKKYYLKYSYIAKVKTYRSVDKKNDRESITLEEFRKLLEREKTCYFCKEDNVHKLGLDRIDNNKGHQIDNVVLCCEKCNMILGDIPFQAKELLKEGLIKIKENNLLSNWEIATKRRKLND